MVQTELTMEVLAGGFGLENDITWKWEASEVLCPLLVIMNYFSFNQLI